MVQVTRTGAGLLLVVAGALMGTASWQRWSDACPWGAGDTRRCDIRQDHRYDFLAPTTGWEPVGSAAELAGLSLLVRFALGARGWARAACVLLFLASPIVAALSYAIGPYDARPWWEAGSGLLTLGAGLCLLVAAVGDRRQTGPGAVKVAAATSEAAARP